MNPGWSASMTRRHKKLAARPRCEGAWGPREPFYLADKSQETHVHRCTKQVGHMGQYCLCVCGSTKQRPRNR